MFIIDESGKVLIQCDKDASGIITIPPFIEVIGKRCFENCNNIKEIIVPDSVRIIEQGAFEECRSLEVVRLSNNIEVIESCVFSYCRNLKSVNLSPKISTIKWRAFQMCSSLNTLEFPSELKTIESEAFIGSGLYSIVLNENIEIIDDYAFCNCHDLQHLSLPYTLKALKLGAFRGCENLQDVEIPMGVEFIGKDVFAGCDSLNYVQIPSSVLYIGSGAFAASKIASIFVSKNNSNYISIDGVLFSKDLSVLHTYPRAKVDTTYRIPFETNIIEDSAFCGCLNLQNVEFHNQIRQLGVESFCHTGIINLLLPNSLEVIPKACFRDCSSLISVSFPTSIKEIEEFAFCDCRKLLNVSIPISVKYIGKSAFCFGYGLLSVRIPNNVEFIGGGAFGWSKVKELYIGIEDLSKVKEEFTDYIDYDNCILYVPFGMKLIYGKHPYFSKFKQIISADI